MIRVLFMGIIAVFLLGLYAYATWYAIQSLIDLNAPTPTHHYPTDVQDGPLMILSFVGGLVSALVISVLAVTPPSESPSKTLINSVQTISQQAASPMSSGAQTFTQVLTFAYLAVWLVCGMSAVIYVFMAGYAKPVPELTASAKSWLGLAIASAYAFFGLRASV